ncbi:tRNA (guanine(46)-N(7))-methyltransferase TrmB [Altererythrobacter sp.]|uniref:tRNA (guanine(46)-N(7))-methyltransferase TrmB n=1 Tax=Altererythrobacter sp. TaxID=1872480 RepID=UPI001B1E7EAA|nr:tRNA (guanine(46)-N(7))-methyltransferase TrmB [Altererythrobacter sp.]MBO6608463.1 tRNA (guanosine(46)-N7)-methyltransferase TrmB [Altererythrobacter sp.]MBO6642022.1 tRNA (guanosine(46)-N7)-methyltransferase TrmB [Altererythrobacter sp.]MBO6709470.1 tRNA (guanosine(46)-N7)-methyltransferase TrmB [Altererythrobacter sp.]MBO6944423.1 tRNA (guanosine(46)-N7)-methyltransferase TrmB [Altererythrobacter sp.]
MSAFKEGDPTTLNRLYGRSQGKPLRARQQALVDNLLPQIAVPAAGPVTSEILFGHDGPLHLEIGFGGGEHLAYRADLLPDHGFIGAEPFVNGVAQALAHVEEQRLPNVRLHWGDAIDVLQRIPDGALTMLYLLHPDPWPKNKHAKRRMMNDGPVKLFADKLKPGGEFRFGTDHPVYLRHALMVMQRHTDRFEWQVNGRKSWENRPSGWCETRYEHKARTVYGHEVWYFRYRRLP